MKIERPFSKNDLNQLLEQRKRQLFDDIDELDKVGFEANSHEYLVAYYSERYQIEPLVIGDEDPSARNMEECKIEKRLIDPFDRRFLGKDFISVDGVRISFSYHFQGSPELFDCQPSSILCSGYPPISIEEDRLVLTREYQVSDNAELPTSEEIESHFRGMRDEVSKGAEFVSAEIIAYNSELLSKIETRLRRREDQVRKYSGLFENLSIPLEKRSDSSGRLELTKKKLQLKTSTSQNKINCFINDSDYYEILDYVRNIYATCERTPQTYSSHDEESLRNIALATLNSIYKGVAVGEAFRNKGKTDICIEQENRAAFVAECKIWNGPKVLRESIDQLLGYLTWRDLKTAIVMFSRNVDFLKVLRVAEETLLADNRCRLSKTEYPNEFDCRFISEGKSGDTTRIRVMIFNLPRN